MEALRDYSATYKNGELVTFKAIDCCKVDCRRAAPSEERAKKATTDPDLMVVLPASAYPFLSRPCNPKTHSFAICLVHFNASCRHAIQSGDVKPTFEQIVRKDNDNKPIKIRAFTLKPKYQEKMTKVIQGGCHQNQQVPSVSEGPSQEEIDSHHQNHQVPSQEETARNVLSNAQLAAALSLPDGKLLFPDQSTYDQLRQKLPMEASRPTDFSTIDNDFFTSMHFAGSLTGLPMPSTSYQSNQTSSQPTDSSDGYQSNSSQETVNDANQIDRFFATFDEEQANVTPDDADISTPDDAEKQEAYSSLKRTLEESYSQLSAKKFRLLAENALLMIIN
jgi:hypothetical protein